MLFDLDAVEHYSEHRKKAMQSAHIIHTTQTWDNVADKIVSILGDDLLRTI